MKTQGWWCLHVYSTIYTIPNKNCFFSHVVRYSRPIATVQPCPQVSTVAEYDGLQTPPPLLAQTVATTVPPDWLEPAEKTQLTFEYFNW